MPKIFISRHSCVVFITGDIACFKIGNNHIRKDRGGHGMKFSRKKFGQKVQMSTLSFHLWLFPILKHVKSPRNSYHTAMSTTIVLIKK